MVQETDDLAESEMKVSWAGSELAGQSVSLRFSLPLLPLLPFIELVSL